MRIIISSPYLDSLGGGERYILTIAEILSKKHTVSLLWGGNKNILIEAKRRFNLNLENITLIHKSLEKTNLFQRYFLLRNYDISIVLTDGSIPFLFAKKNFLHIQVPFHKIQHHNFLAILKFKFINGIICNSKFTNGWAKKSYPTNNYYVLYPPVDTLNITSGVKENIIFSVARFSSHLNGKRQDILLEAFRKFYKKNPGYQLILAGSSNQENNYLSHLLKESSDLPVKFLVNPSSKELLSYYKKARYFWHAAGYGVDQQLNPEQTEHFGIVLVEAMAAGCFVCAVNRGGATEIIQSGKNGFLWEKIDELANCQKYLKPKVIAQAKIDSAKFSKQKFQKSLLKILNISQ